MTIDEAIKHCEEVATEKEDNARWKLTPTFQDECIKCAAEHRQLAEWLTELKDLREENKVLTSECDRLIKEKGELLKQHEQIAEYKRLLKAAVEDIYKARQGCNCNICDMPPEPTERCQYENGEDCQFKWRYTDEALKLIES